MLRTVLHLLGRMTAAAFLLVSPEYLDAPESTTITLTRAEIAQMASFWETNTIAISPLATAQYPSFAGNWEFIFPHTSISPDGDIHTDMAVDASGTGASGNNIGASPIVAEVVNASNADLNHLNSLNGRRASFRGIFRFYTEHPGERHFELHPLVGLDTWNGVQFLPDSDYRDNIVADPDGTTHANSTLISLLNGSQSMNATVQADNQHVDFTLPSPSVNYVQYAGVVVSAVQSDGVSTYFLLRPDLVSSATVRCRLVTQTIAAGAANGLSANGRVTVNAMTRTDVAAVQSQLGTLGAGQSRTFARPVELIVLGLPGAVAVTSAVSRKTQGGGLFDIELPLTGARGVECRRGSGLNQSTHSLVVTFDSAVTVGGLSVASSNGLATATMVVSNNVVTITLSSVADGQHLVVALTNVNNGTSTANVTVPVDFLLGDTNGDRIVNAADALQTRAAAGSSATSVNYRLDVNSDGTINASDTAIVRGRSGASLP